MNNRIPPVLVPTLEGYLTLIDQRLPNLLSAFYIVGSIALDEFNSHFSDVDFIAVTSHLVHEKDVEILREIHQEVDQRYPTWKLSGVYLLENDLGKQSREIGECIVFHDGKLKSQTHFESHPVTWWTLKNCGIPVLGSDPKSLPLDITENDLVAWTLENMNTYWKSWTQQPGNLIMLLSDWGIQWTVLGVARQLYTIRERKVITKQRSGEYALSVIPEQWHQIIKEAIRIRTKSPKSLYLFRFVRMLEAVKFMKYVIQLPN